MHFWPESEESYKALFKNDLDKTTKIIIKIDSDSKNIFCELVN